MNRGSSYVMTSTLGIAVLLMIEAPARWTRTAVNAGRETDAAFCDGAFQAQLDVENGKKPHIASGRWNSDEDRALFMAGYQQGFRQFTAGYLGKVAQPEAAAVAGYRDGVVDGTRQRRAMQPFGFNHTGKYLSAGQDSANEKSVWETYQRNYRLAYANGYQMGYYSPREEEESKNITDAVGHL